MLLWYKAESDLHPDYATVQAGLVKLNSIQYLQ